MHYLIIKPNFFVFYSYNIENGVLLKYKVECTSVSI